MRGEPILDMFMAAVALAVGAIPEGLPAVLTITLAIGVSRMAKRHSIIRKLPAVETLGSTSVICSDKTGTLTQNQMTVEEIFSGDKLYTVSGVGYSPIGDFMYENTKIEERSEVALMECLIAGLLCNDSNIVYLDERWKIEGDPTEAALLTSALKSGISRSEIQSRFPRINTIPLNQNINIWQPFTEIQNPGIMWFI
jgi:Ca2+-transporting ATPase